MGFQRRWSQQPEHDPVSGVLPLERELQARPDSPEPQSTWRGTLPDSCAKAGAVTAATRLRTVNKPIRYRGYAAIIPRGRARG